MEMPEKRIWQSRKLKGSRKEKALKYTRNKQQSPQHGYQKGVLDYI